MAGDNFQQKHCQNLHILHYQNALTLTSSIYGSYHVLGFATGICIADEAAIEAKIGFDREVKRSAEASPWSQSVQILLAVLCSAISGEGGCSSSRCQ